ncbi:MAG: hypothetical protein V4594_00110 [Bacteroidota bacterium]
MISAKTKQRWDYYSVMKTEKDAGAHDAYVKIATKLKAKGYSINKISEITELSIEEIEKL